jgi:hypothetical protein
MRCEKRVADRAVVARGACSPVHRRPGVLVMARRRLEGGLGESCWRSLPPVLPEPPAVESVSGWVARDAANAAEAGVEADVIKGCLLPR